MIPSLAISNSVFICPYSSGLIHEYLDNCIWMPQCQQSNPGLFHLNGSVKNTQRKHNKTWTVFMILEVYCILTVDDVMAWKMFPHQCSVWEMNPMVTGGLIHKASVVWSFDVYCVKAWINCWTNSRVVYDFFYTVTIKWRHRDAAFVRKYTVHFKSIHNFSLELRV